MHRPTSPPTKGPRRPTSSLIAFKKLGVTHVLLVEAKMSPPVRSHARLLPAGQGVSRRRPRTWTSRSSPSVYPIGYSGTWYHYDANLASGIPVKNAPFIVEGSVAQPDPANTPKLVNGDFEQAAIGSQWPIAGWKPQPRRRRRHLRRHDDETRRPAVVEVHQFRQAPRRTSPRNPSSRATRST